MNNKGFAISGIIYTILLIFLIVLAGILSLFNSRKNVLDNLKNKVVGEVNTTSSIQYDPFDETGTILEFTAKAKGYYQFELYSPKINNINGDELVTEIYLEKGETLYFLIGSTTYNQGITEIRSSKNAASTIAKVSSNEFDTKEYNGRNFFNTSIQKNVVISNTGKIIVNYLNKNRLNSNLNKVKYIKNCIQGSSNGLYVWTEIRAIVDGDNKAKGKNVTGSSKNIAGHDYSYITDGSMTTYAQAEGNGEQCVIVDLDRTYNLDSIFISHSNNVEYYGNRTYVSTNGNNYTLVHMSDDLETFNGININAFDPEQVTKVGNIDVPIKEFDGAKWLRVFHHNNLNGKELWSSVSQSNLSDGYDTVHRQSILSYLNNYQSKDGFEFLLEYSDLTGYNRWKQSSNPLTITKNSSMKKVPGYTPIKISWDSNGWAGLAKSNNGTSLLDGSVGSNENFYAIGATSTWNGGIMGPGSVTKGSVDLWIRIDN